MKGPDCVYIFPQVRKSDCPILSDDDVAKMKMHPFAWGFLKQHLTRKGLTFPMTWIMVAARNAGIVCGQYVIQDGAVVSETTWGKLTGIVSFPEPVNMFFVDQAGQSYSCTFAAQKVSEV